MQILLIGQTELEDVLKNPRLGQLVQRIVVHERLEPLNREQIFQYVSYRLNKAGRGDILLSKGACKLVHGGSRGIPRLINRIMDRTLLLASVDKVTVITKRHVESAIATMKDIDDSRRFGPKAKTALTLSCGLFVAVLLACLFFFG